MLLNTRQGGVSHSYDEHTAEADIAAGAEAYVRAAVQLVLPEALLSSHGQQGPAPADDLRGEQEPQEVPGWQEERAGGPGADADVLPAEPAAAAGAAVLAEDVRL